MCEVQRQLLLAAGSATHAAGGHTDGIRIAANGSLDALLTLRDAFGVTSTVILRDSTVERHA